MSRPWASNVLPLVRPLSSRNTDTAPWRSIFRMRLPTMSLKYKSPLACQAGPSRKQIVAAVRAFVSAATRSAGKSTSYMGAPFQKVKAVNLAAPAGRIKRPRQIAMPGRLVPLARTAGYDSGHATAGGNQNRDDRVQPAGAGGRGRVGSSGRNRGEGRAAWGRPAECRLAGAVSRPVGRAASRQARLEDRQRPAATRRPPGGSRRARHVEFAGVAGPDAPGLGTAAPCVWAAVPGGDRRFSAPRPGADRARSDLPGHGRVGAPARDAPDPLGRHGRRRPQ